MKEKKNVDTFEYDSLFQWFYLVAQARTIHKMHYYK